MTRLLLFVFFCPFPGIGQSNNFPEKGDLTKIYTQAISDFIIAANKQKHSRFDTLYFGKHVYGQPDDFPDIELPGTIQNTRIILISPESGLKKQKADKSLVYINLVGWVNKEGAEFIFVLFSNGFEHLYDCYIDYTYDVHQKVFHSKQLRFEYFLQNTKGAIHGSAQPNPVSVKAGPAKDSEIFFIKYPSARLLVSIIILGCGLLLMWTLNKKFNKNDKLLDHYYEKTWHNENLSMDEHHTVFHSYYRKEPAGCFLIAGLVVVGGIAGVIGSVGWYLYVLIFTN